MYELLTGQLPFYAEERKMMFRLIVTEKVKYPKTFSSEAREIVSKLLIKNPDRRLGSINDAEELMEHPFFAVINWSDLKKKRITPYLNLRYIFHHLMNMVSYSFLAFK
jgi:serine/threonine protein kinase